MLPATGEELVFDEITAYPRDTSGFVLDNKFSRLLITKSTTKISGIIDKAIPLTFIIILLKWPGKPVIIWSILILSRLLHSLLHL